MTNSVKRCQLPVAGRRWVVVVAAILPALALFAERQPYTRYQSIVDRQMFGQPPAGFDPTKNPSEVSAKDERAKGQELTKEQAEVKSSIHFSVINVTPAGDTAVGFTDNSDSKNPRHYYLKVGESRDGWTVKEADALAASMTVAKGEIEVSLTLGGDSSGGNATKKLGSAPNGVVSRSPSGAPRAQSSGLLGARANGPSRGLGSLRERRALREQQREAEKAAAAEEKRVAAEKEAAREAEREAERAEREKEREEQRAQLMQIKEELRKAREAKEQSEAEKPQDGENAGNGTVEDAP